MIAAAIVEENLEFQNREKCHIIHCLTCEYDCNKKLVPSLLNEIFQQDHMKDKNCVFVYQYGKDPMIIESESTDMDDTLVDLFQQCNFKIQDCPSVKDDIRKHSLTMIGASNDIVTSTNNLRVYTIPRHKDDHRFLHFNNANFCKFKYDGKHIMSYSHTFGW